MFEKIKSIEVDRKNSLPVADLHARYRKTGTPVIFGDLCRRWPALDVWSADYLNDKIGSAPASIYSNDLSINHGRPSKAVMQSSVGVFLDELLPEDNDLRISSLPLKSISKLENDFSYPRLGLGFDLDLTSLGVGGKGSIEPMKQASTVINSVHCNFGEPVSVLLIPPIQSGFMYRVGNSRHTVRDIDFDKPDFKRYPALKYLSGYVAELSHGDALFIPAGFWYCIANRGVSIRLSFESIQASTSQYIGTASNSIINRLLNFSSLSSSRLTALEQKIVSRTNDSLAKAKKAR